VSDLSLEQIQVFEDGQAVEVTHFRPPAGTDPAADSGNQGERASRVARNPEIDVVQTSMRNQVESVANKQDTPSILALETGGKATFNTNDFRPAVRAAIAESLASYELAYISPTAGDGDVHSIRVEVEPVL